MKLHIVVTRDIKADVYSQPQFVPNLGGFLRSFADECAGNNPGNPQGMSIIEKHPEDFEVYELGWYGDHDAHFELFERPKQIAVGSNYITR